MENIIHFRSTVNKQFAYLLGLIWADGSLNYNSLILECKSEDMVDFVPIISEVFQFKCRERQRYKNGEKFGKLQTSALFTNKILANFLREMDFKQKSKISPYKVLSHIPGEYHHNFWHGFFDGDGSISFSKGGNPQFNITASINYEWGALKEVLNYLKIKFTERKVNYIRHFSSELKCSRTNDVLKFKDYLYPNGEFGLKRKYYRFLSIKKLPERIPTSLHSNINRRKNGCWVFRPTINGRRICKYFKTEDAAIRFKDDFYQKLGNS